MKQKFLLFFAMTTVITVLHAQKKKDQKTPGFAITANEKGGHSWKEVRQVDNATGEEQKRIYQSQSATEALNARTGKPVVQNKTATTGVQTITFTSAAPTTTKKVVNLDEELNGHNKTGVANHQMMIRYTAEPGDQPFSTSSAALAYDKKHDRLYYTPLAINQLRYIDLRDKTPRVYYFENEAFGVVKGMGDVASQITRMAFGSDGNGYALSNDANHLVRFTTGKRPEIADLGALSDDASNEEFSVHTNRMYGGDMVADAAGYLYLITAYHYVFKVDIKSRNAKYLGRIKGLPEGFSTNGAMVEKGSKVIIASSQNTQGYYRFDLNSMQAEKMEGSVSVYNASDLANGNLAFDKDDEKEEKKPESKNENLVTESKQTPATDAPAATGIAVYPNPVTNGVVRLSFSSQPAGRYQVQVVDLSGKRIVSREVNIGSERQVEELALPSSLAKGNYIVQVYGDNGRVNTSTKIVVQ